MTFYELKVGVGSKEEGVSLLKKLVEEKILSGGNIITSYSCFYWQDKVNEVEDYIVVSIVCSTDLQGLETRISKLTHFKDPLITFTELAHINKKAADHIMHNTDPNKSCSEAKQL